MPSVLKARPTIYNGIQMRSRLEADYAAWLDQNGERWEYEPECFANADGQWLPDFRVGDAGTLVEVKPAGLLTAEIPGVVGFYELGDKFLRRMTIAWSSRPDAHLELAFWNYGGSAYLTISATCAGAPWFAWPGGHHPALLWPGMDQLRRNSAVSGLVARGYQGGAP